MLLVFIVICIGLYFIVQTLAFKHTSPEYKKSCRPVVIWNLVFFAICGFSVCMGLDVVTGFFSPYDKWMDTGSNFGQLGIGIAGQLMQRDMESRFASTPGLHDYMDNAALNIILSSVLAIITLIFGILSINGVKGKSRNGINSLTTFFLISGICASASLGLFMTLCDAYRIIEAGIEGNYQTSEPNYMLTWIIWTVASVVCVIFFSWKLYRPILSRILAMNSTPTAYNFRNPRKSMGQSIALAVSQALNQNPDAGKPAKSCPYCGETILAVAVKCKHCGEWMPKEEKKKMVECPVCGEMVEEGVEICPYCKEKTDGSSIRREESKPKTIICPVCAEEIPANVDICPICNEKIR